MNNVDSGKVINHYNRLFFEHVLYKFNRKKKQVSSYYVLLHYNGDMFYFRDRMRTNFIGMHNLSFSILVNDNPTVKSINDTNYYCLELTLCDKVKQFLCKTEDDWKLCMENLKIIIKNYNFAANYTLKNVITESKYTSLHTAYHNRTKEVVTVKIVDKTKINKKSDMYFNEILLMKYLHHPNIAKFITSYEDYKCIYVILESLTGDNLMNYLMSQDKELTNKRKLQIMYQMASVVDYLHSLGIIHRDIKPNSILMTDKSPEAMLKIYDFSISTYLSEEEASTTKCGTLNYMAPEIFLGKAYNKVVDVWSLGMSYYYILFFSLPFGDLDDSDGNKKKKVEIICYKDIAFPESDTVGKHIVIACLKKNPNERCKLKLILEELRHY
jgi:serine/threonine protein kinase